MINTGIRYWVGSSNRDVDYNTEQVYVIGTYKNKLLYIAHITRAVTMLEYYSGISAGRTEDIYRVQNEKLECRPEKR